MDDTQFKRNIDRMLGRTQFINAVRHAKDSDGNDIAIALNAVVKSDLEALAEALKEGGGNESSVQLAKAAARGDRDAVMQLCALRVTTINNYILANQQKLGFFFEMVDLRDEEVPYEQNETVQELRVSYVGPDGEPSTTKILKPQDETKIPLHYLTSEEFEYLLTDPYKGQISNAAKATVMLGYDMTNAMEAKSFELLSKPVAQGGAYGDFTLTGKKSLRTFLANSYINVANLPTTNDITLEDTTAQSRFRYDVFREIAKYGEQWGNAFPDGPLVPTGRVLVPSSEVSDIARTVVPTGQTSNDVADQLLTQGWARVSIHGRTYILMADNTLAPGVCYAEYNRKPGKWYTKSGLDSEIVDDSVAMKKKNKESRLMRKLVGGSINSFTRIFTARFRYRAAA
jgi:hypothetical protein